MARPPDSDPREVLAVDPMTLEALKVGALPLVVGGAGLAMARALRPERRGLVLGLTVVLAFSAVFVAVVGWPRVPARQALELLPLLAAGGVVLAASRGRALTLTLAVVLAGCCAWFLLGRVSSLGGRDLWSWLLATVSGLVVLWWPLLSANARASVCPGVLAVVAGGAAGAAMFSGSAKLAELTGGLAVCLALVALVNLVRPAQHAARGASLSGGVALGALLVCDQHFTELPPGELALLLAGWATLHLGRARFAQAWSERRAMVFHALLAAVPVLAALAMGWMRYQTALESNPYY